MPDGHAPSRDLFAIDQHPPKTTILPGEVTVDTLVKARVLPQERLGSKDETREDVSGVRRVSKNAQRAAEADAKHLDVLQAKVASQGNEYQERRDAQTQIRFEGLHDRLVEAELELEVRLSSLGVPVTEWAECKQHPHKIGIQRRFTERFGADANRPFSLLAETYQRLASALDQERAAYLAACTRKELVSREDKKKSRAKEQVYSRHEVLRDAEVDIRKIAQELFFAQTVEKKELTREAAIECHKRVATTLMKLTDALALFGDQAADTLADRENRLTIQSLVRRIEQQIDTIRIQEWNDLNAFAHEVVITQNAGAPDDAELLQQELMRRLTRLAPLFVVNRASRVTSDMIEARSDFHVQHARLFMRKEWETGSGASPSFERFTIQVENARKRAYPFGPALEALPIETYSKQG